MSFDKILTLQQILDSENNFIVKNSEKILIDNAGKKVGEFLFKNYKDKRFCFICGSGNNGKDGKIASMYLTRKKIFNEVFDTTKFKRTFDYSSFFKEFDILVDCIFGTGLNRKINNFYANIIDKINNSKKMIISIDTPSGVECDTGKILGSAVNANITLCMGFFKPAHFLIPGKKFCGKKKVIKLNLKVSKNIKPKIFLNSSKIFSYLPKFNNYYYNQLI